MSWEYIKGSEFDFEGAPEWCTQVIIDAEGAERGFDEHWTGLQSSESRFCWERTSDGMVFSCKESANQEDWPVLAQRRRNHNISSDCGNEKLAEHFDTVQRPAQYNQSDIECIDAIKASMTDEEFRGFLKGNVQKYVWRSEHKGGAEDYRKAQYYLDRLVKELSK